MVKIEISKEELQNKVGRLSKKENKQLPITSLLRRVARPGDAMFADYQYRSPCQNVLT